MHLKRLPACAPELNLGEGLWEQLKGVELRDAVQRGRHKPREIQGFFQGATL
jgi:hypothetical protein